MHNEEASEVIETKESEDDMWFGIRWIEGDEDRVTVKPWERWREWRYGTDEVTNLVWDRDVPPDTVYGFECLVMEDKVN